MRHKRRKVGLYGKAPSDHPEFAPLLADRGGDSMPRYVPTPDALPAVVRILAKSGPGKGEPS